MLIPNPIIDVVSAMRDYTGIERIMIKKRVKRNSRTKIQEWIAYFVNITVNSETKSRLLFKYAIK